MSNRRSIAAIALLGFIMSGCITVAVAPGAEKVKITTNAGDVASCKAVGNVTSRPMGAAATNADLQNKTFGLGGNAVFITATVGDLVEGVAYTCP